MKKRYLIFLTSEFPFGAGETFIENEFPFLEASFDKIIIVSNATKQRILRVSLEKTEVLHFPYELAPLQKAASFSGIFEREFWKELWLIVSKYKLRLNPAILKILLVSLGKGRELAAFIKSEIKNRNINPQDVWVYSYWFNDMAVGIAALKQVLPEIKAFSRAHGWEVYIERHQLKYLPLRHFLLENLDACFAVAENSKRYLDSITAYKFSDKIKVSRLGTLSYARQEYDFNKKTFKVISCSSLIPLKRVALIIESLAKLGQHKINWIHFGTGLLEGELIDLAKNKLSPLPNIQYEFKGQVTNQELMNFYSKEKIDLFINVSEYEGVPVSVMEAMSFGIPVIATDVGGVSEIVNDKNGKLLSSNPSAEDISEAINFFVEMQEEQYLQYRKHALACWLGCYNAEKNYRGFIEEILKL